MNITITDTVLTGNMGDGWKDEDDAASAYAAYLESEYRAAAEKRFPGAEVDVDIHIQNATGWSGDAQVISDGDISDGDIESLGEFERDLADGRYWETWVNSDDAAKYIA